MAQDSFDTAPRLRADENTDAEGDRYADVPAFCFPNRVSVTDRKRITLPDGWSYIVTDAHHHFDPLFDPIAKRYADAFAFAKSIGFAHPTLVPRELRGWRRWLHRLWRR